MHADNPCNSEGSEVQCYLRLFLKTNKVEKKKPPALPGGSNLPWTGGPQHSMLPPLAWSLVLLPRGRCDAFSVFSLHTSNSEVGQLGAFPFLKSCCANRAVVNEPKLVVREWSFHDDLGACSCLLLSFFLPVLITCSNGFIPIVSYIHTHTSHLQLQNVDMMVTLLAGSHCCSEFKRSMAILCPEDSLSHNAPWVLEVMVYIEVQLMAERFVIFITMTNYESLQLLLPIGGGGVAFRTKWESSIHLWAGTNYLEGNLTSPSNPCSKTTVTFLSQPVTPSSHKLLAVSLTFKQNVVGGPYNRLATIVLLVDTSCLVSQ